MDNFGYTENTFGSEKKTRVVSKALLCYQDIFVLLKIYDENSVVQIERYWIPLHHYLNQELTRKQQAKIVGVGRTLFWHDNIFQYIYIFIC